MSEKQIILEPNKQPVFVGAWTVGEVLAMAESLARWAQSLTVTTPEERPELVKNGKQ